MKCLEDYKRDRVAKYAQYFKGNEILPISEVSKVQEPWILSLVSSDLKTRRLTGLQKDKFNLKRRRDSREGHTKIVCPNTPPAASTTEPPKAVTEATNPVHPAPKLENVPSSETGWTQVSRKGKKKEGSPKKPDNPHQTSAQPLEQDPGTNPFSSSSSFFISNSQISSPRKKHPSRQHPASQPPARLHPAKHPKPEEPMWTTINLKRRRDSGERHAKKLCPNTPPQQTSSKEKTLPNPKKSPIKNDPINSPGKNNPSDKNNPNNTLLKNSSFSKNPTPNKPTPLKPRVHPFILLSPRLPLSPPEHTLHPRTQSETRALSKDSESRRRTKSVSPVENKAKQEKKNLFQTAVNLCFTKMEAFADFQLKKKLKPLIDQEIIQNKLVCNPFNFRGALMVTTFVRSVGCRTQRVCEFLNKACQTDAGVRLAELEHPSLKVLIFSAGRVRFTFPFTWHGFKNQVLHGCWKSVQRWASSHWSRRWLFETGHWRPYPWGFSDHCRHWIGDGGQLVVADVAVKNFEFRVVAVYAPNLPGERRSFARWLGPFLNESKRTVLVGDWNAILYPNIDRAGWGASGSGRLDSGWLTINSLGSVCG